MNLYISESGFSQTLSPPPAASGRRTIVIGYNHFMINILTDVKMRHISNKFFINIFSFIVLFILLLTFHKNSIASNKTILVNNTSIDAVTNNESFEINSNTNIDKKILLTINSKSKKKFYWQVFQYTLIIMTIIIAISFLWILALKKAVSTKTKALQDSEYRIKALIDALPDFMFTISNDGILLDYHLGNNQSFKEALIFPPEEIIGKHQRDILSKEIYKSFEAAYEKASKMGGLHIFEFNLVVEGKKTYIESRIIKTKNNHFIVILRDVTEKIINENEIMQKQRLESITTLARGIAHDFNNILMAISGNVSILKMDTEQGSETYSILEDLETASIRAKNLTDQLLTFAKSGSPNKQAASVIDIIKDSVGFVLHGSNIIPVFNLENGLHQVKIDKNQISTVIQNLTINAKQSMPNGGKIFINANNVSQIYDSSILKKGQYVKIEIIDSGIGISDNDIKRIFDPYFTTRENSSGLGLSIVYSIIKNHNGHIEIFSSPNKGTAVRIFLIALTDEIDKIKTIRNVSEKNILILDDDPVVLKVTEKMLTALGFSVKLAINSQDAIDIYSKQHFDAVLMDLTIPGESGPKNTVDAINSINSNAKIIITTGYSTDPIISTYRENGFCDYIIKPYNIEDLQKVFSKLWG